MKKPWSGRFKDATSGTVEAFTESISFDRRLWKYDIQGSMAHALMLGRQGIIPKKDADAIVRGLKQIYAEMDAGRFRFRPELEDIHMNIEAALTERIGEAGKKLHTARSRNDQISLDFRLYLRQETENIISLIKGLQKTVVSLAEKHLDVIMPGYTHLQRAQPVLLSHYLMAYVEMFQRDCERFGDALKRIDVMPLGSCALAGTSLPIDRAYVAKALGFRAVTENSIDSVADRDFAVEFLSCASILMIHLSRLAEELVLWSSGEFGFVELPDSFTTGSSIMPQKKNPDVAELIRGKTGRVYGSLVTLLTLMKGLPLAYNRDMQEDKPPVFDSVDTAAACLTVLNEMLPRVTFHEEKMRKTAGEGFSTATDMAEYLVRKGVPFRKAHEIAGKVVLSCVRKKKRLEEMTLQELKRFSSVFGKDIFAVLDPVRSVQARSSRGGTSRCSVKRQISRYKKKLA